MGEPMVLGMPNTGKNLALVALNLHAAAAAIPLLSPPQLMVHFGFVNGHTCRHAGNHGN